MHKFASDLWTWKKLRNHYNLHLFLLFLWSFDFLMILNCWNNLAFGTKSNKKTQKKNNMCNPTAWFYHFLLFDNVFRDHPSEVCLKPAVQSAHLNHPISCCSVKYKKYYSGVEIKIKKCSDDVSLSTTWTWCCGKTMGDYW